MKLKASEHPVMMAFKTLSNTKDLLGPLLFRAKTTLTSFD